MKKEFEAGSTLLSAKKPAWVSFSVLPVKLIAAALPPEGPAVMSVSDDEAVCRS